MSITIGKRGYNDSLSELSHERYFQHQFDVRRCKPNSNSNDSSFDPQLSIKQKNLNKLESMFPNKTKNELTQLMEDFDDEMELLIDVLKKQNKENSMIIDNSAELKNKKREIRNLKGIVKMKCSNNQSAQKNEMQVEETGKKQKEEMFESNRKSEVMNNEGLVQSVAEELVKKLQGSQNLNDAYNDVVQALKFFEEQINTATAKKEEKVNQENSLLKKAFYKQFKKYEDLEKNHKIVSEDLAKNIEELRKSQNINYSLSLLLKSLDSNQTNSFNHEIF